MMPFYVVRAINRYCQVLNLRGEGCGPCQIVELCQEDIKEYKAGKNDTR
jgi:hypothetical protein